MWGGSEGTPTDTHRRARWNAEDYQEAPHEVYIYVKDREAFDPVERLRWHENFLRTGNTAGVKVLNSEGSIVHRQNTVFTAVHARFNVVVSISFPSLTTVDARTGQCLYDRACISLARLVESLASGDAEVGGHKLPHTPRIYLTVLLHQAHHSAVDALCQDVLIDPDPEGAARLVGELMGRLKAAEDNAFQALQQIRGEGGAQDTMQNPFAQGSLGDVLQSAMQRIPQQHNEGTSVFVMIADFRRSSFLNGAIVTSARERVAACDAQLVIIDVGNDHSRQRNLMALASCTHGVLIDWSYLEHMGETLGTTGQPELSGCGYFGNAVGPGKGASFFSLHSEALLAQIYPVALAGAILSARVNHPLLDTPHPRELRQRVRQAVLTRCINILGKETDAGMPWAIDGQNADRSVPESIKQEASGRSLVAKWTIALQDPACLLETRVREGWCIVYPSTPGDPSNVQVAMPWMTGRNSRWLSATLVYEATPVQNTHLGAIEPICDVTVWAHGPRGLVYEYEPGQGGSKRREESSARDVQRLHDYMEELRKRDELKATMLRERLAGNKDIRLLHERIAQHSTDEGCSQAWHMTAHLYCYSAVLSDSSSPGTVGNPSDGLFTDIYDRVDARLFELQLYVQTLMQKWPSGTFSGDTNRPGVLGSSPRPYVRRLTSGGIVVAQFFSSRAGEACRLPLCLEVRVSFFNVAYIKRKGVLNELRSLICTVPSSTRSQGNVPANLRQYQRNFAFTARLARDELSAVLSDILNRCTEQVVLEAGHTDTSDTDASLGDQQRQNSTPRAMSRRDLYHKMSIAPLSYQFTHRRWRWLVDEGRTSVLAHIFNVLFQVRLKDGFVLLQSRDTHSDFVMMKGAAEALVLYSVQVTGSAIEARVWVEQSDRGRQKVAGALAFPARERFAMFERMYLEHSVVLHAYATFAQVATAIEMPAASAIIPHAKIHMRSVTDHDHMLYDTPITTTWVCSRCGKRQAQATNRWCCNECPQLDYAICSPCVTECEAPRTALPVDANRFCPLPHGPSTVPLWRRHISPEADGAETLRLPQIDLLLRGGAKHFIALPCISDCTDQPDDQSASSADEKTLLAGLSEPLVRLLDALQEGLGPTEVMSRAKSVLVAPDTPTMKKAKAVLGCEPWRMKPKGDCSVDLTVKSNSKQLRAQLIAAVDAARKEGPKEGGKTSSLGGAETSSTDDRWTSANAAGQLYSRLLNCVNLLCPVRVDVSQSDFPGNQYPADLVPPFASTLATCPMLHCFIRPADVRATRPSDAVTGVVVTVLPSLESARHVPVTLEGDSKPTQCFVGVVHEVAVDQLSWDVLAQVAPATTSWGRGAPGAGGGSGAKSPQSGSLAFKKFLEAAHTMIFAFGVYRMLQCGEPVSPADIKFAQTMCVDYNSNVDVTDLVKVHASRGNAVPHEAVNNTLKSALDKNFGCMKGTECHYFFRGHTVTETKVGSHRQSVVHTRVSAASSRTIRPRVAPSIASSCAAPSSVSNQRPANEGLTAATVAMIPSAAGLTRQPLSAALNGDVDDGKTSFPSAPSEDTSTEGDEPECDSPRLADGQSRLCDTSQCYDTDSDGDGSVVGPPGSATAAEPAVEQYSPEEGDDLPIFMMMTITYEVLDERPGVRRPKQTTYSLPVHHTILDANDNQPKLPVVSGMLQRARLSLVASSIPRQFFEMSSRGFRPTRKEAVRKCVLDAPAIESMRRFSTTRDAYVVTDEGLGPQLDQICDPYQFFPHRPKKLMERTTRRVQAEVHRSQLAYQLTRPLRSEPPAQLAHRIEALRPRHWTKMTLRLLVVGDPLKRPHLTLFFRDWLAESPELRVLNQQDKPADDEGTLVLTLLNTPAEDAAVVAALVAAVACTDLSVVSAAVPAASGAAFEPPLSYWLLLKIRGGRAVYRGPGGVHGLGMDRSVIKLRLWLFGPDLAHPAEQQALLSRTVRCLRNVQMNLNRALLLEECHALSPHCISDMLVPPEGLPAVKFVAVKVAVTIVAYTYCVACAGEASARRRNAVPPPPQAVTPQNALSASQKPRGKSASAVRPGSVAGESVQSFSLLNSSVQKRQALESAFPQTGALVSRDVVPYESWERWGGLACTMHVVSELNLGVYTEPTDVDACLFQVWNNWQCDNRLRTYLWRGKDEVYYFQFKLTVLVDYLPYKCVAVASCAAALVAAEQAGERAYCAAHVVALCACIASVRAALPELTLTHVTSQEFLSSLTDVSPALLDSFVSLPREPSITLSNTLSQTVSEAHIDSDPQLGNSGLLEHPVSASLAQSTTTAQSQSQSQSLIAHDLDHGRLRATMMIYSVRPPPDEVIVPLAAEFKGCMRSATVLALGGHLQKTDGRLSYDDLLELQHRAEKTLLFVSPVPEDLLAYRERVEVYVHSHMKKWATRVRLTADPLPDVPPPHFIYPRISTRSDSRHADIRNTPWLACIHMSLTEVQTSLTGETGASDLGALHELDPAEDGDRSSMSTCLRFQVWINGDSKELDPAITLVREALQSCVVQVFCEASIETRLPALDKVRVSDIAAMQPLCQKAQGRYAKWDRRRQQDRQWESCVSREYNGTIQPSSALPLVHDIVLLLRDLHSRLVNEPARTRQSSLQPVAFYAEACDGLCDANSEWRPTYPDTLIPVPDFLPATMKHHEDRAPIPTYDYYVLCGRGEKGELSDEWSAMHYSQSTDESQTATSCPTSTPASCDLLRFYDSEESSERPCFLCVKVSGSGIYFQSYNLKGDFIKGIQVGIASIVAEVQKRYVLQASILHQKMGLCLPAQAFVYPQDSLLFRDTGAQAEVGMSAIDEMFTVLPYNKEVLESTLAEATGVKQQGGRGAALLGANRTAVSNRRPSTNQWSSVLNKQTASGTILGVGGISSRAAAVAAAAAQHVNVQSGRVGQEFARHVISFKSVMATEQQAAQQVRARDAVCRDLADFREAIRAHGQKERHSCLLHCPVATRPLPPQVLVVAVLCAAVVSNVLGPTTLRQLVRQQTRFAATAAALASAVCACVESPLSRSKIDAKHLKVVPGRCTPDRELRFSTWPSYFVARSRLKGFVANCVRMRQSSRLYHCQRVPFLLNKARSKLLLGAVDDMTYHPQEEVDASALACWRRVLTRLMREYMLCLAAETEKKLGGEAWLTTCVTPEDLLAVDRKGPSQDDEVIRSYINNTATLCVNNLYTHCTTTSFIAVTESSGGVLLIDLSVREACFSLEFCLFDAAAANTRKGADGLQRGSGTQMRTPAQPMKFHRLLAQIRSQLHMNSMFYDLQTVYMHEALRAEKPRPHYPAIDWLSVLSDAVLLYERPPLYSVNYVGCKRVTVTIPQEILSEIHTADEGSAELTAGAQKKALGRFFGYVCDQARKTLRSEDTVALLMHDDSGHRLTDAPYECDGVAVCRLDTLDTDCLALPLDVYVVCAVDLNIGRDRKLSPPPDNFIEACYAAFRDDVKRRCDDAVRNYRIHRLWKRMQQQKITTAEVNGLLGRVSDGGLCSIAKREVIPMMDPSCLSCYQSLDIDTWAQLCAACANRHQNERFAIFAPSHQSNSATTPDTHPPHWLFVPRRGTDPASFNAPTGDVTGPTVGVGAVVAAPEPHAIIVEFTANRGVNVWWCSPKAVSEHPVTHTPAPSLNGDDARFFADWVNVVTETLWATSC